MGIEGGFSSLSENRTVEDSLVGEECHFLVSPASFSGVKLAVSGGVLAGKGSCKQNMAAPL